MTIQHMLIKINCIWIHWLMQYFHSVLWNVTVKVVKKMTKIDKIHCCSNIHNRHHCQLHFTATNQMLFVELLKIIFSNTTRSNFLFVSLQIIQISKKQQNVVKKCSCLQRYFYEQTMHDRRLGEMVFRKLLSK